MKFTKDQFSFLRKFTTISDISDSRRITNDKLKICADPKYGFVTFSLFSDKGGIVYQIPNIDNDDFTVIYPITQFYNFVKSVANSEIVELKDGKIHLNSTTSQYEFDSYQLVMTDERRYLEIAKASPSSLYNISNIDKLKIASNFIGKGSDDDKLDTVGIFNGKFVATDRTNGGCIISTNNTLTNFFLPQSIIRVLQDANLANATISEYNTPNLSVYHIKIDDLYYFFPIHTYALLDITSDEAAEKYNHKHEIVLQKDKFLESLNRMQIMSFANKDSEIFIQCYSSNAIRLLNKEHNKSFEQVAVTNILDEEIIGKEYPVSSQYFQKHISLVDGNELHLYVDSDPVNMIIMKITGATTDSVILQVLSS